MSGWICGRCGRYALLMELPLEDAPPEPWWSCQIHGDTYLEWSRW